jgi:ATPase
LKTKIVLDTSIVIDGEISKKIDADEINENHEILIPIAVIDELQSQACKQKEHGTIGLLELKKIREKSIEKKNRCLLCWRKAKYFRN